MPLIRMISEQEADGRLAELYQQWKAANPGRAEVPEILRCFSLRPDLLGGMMDISYPLHFQDGFLTRRTKEMIATLVSGLNQCPY